MYSGNKTRSIVAFRADRQIPAILLRNILGKIIVIISERANGYFLNKGPRMVYLIPSSKLINGRLRILLILEISGFLRVMSPSFNAGKYSIADFDSVI